jgi:sugar lactone lactonase YvrE
LLPPAASVRGQLKGSIRMNRSLTTLVDGIAFGEAPRWREDGLYIADIHADRVLRVNVAGGFEVVATFGGPVSGLGWLPDGRMLVVSMHDRRVLRQEAGDTFVEHADLSGIATWHANDMVVAADGTAYVGNFGFQIAPVRAEARPAAIAMVTPAGTVSVAVDGLWFPNGMVITPDGRTLVVAESGTRAITAFGIAASGELVNRRPWGQMDVAALPDGICLDAENAIWIASPPTREVLRMREGGEVLERIATEQQAVACMLGGDDRRTLFILTAESLDPAWCREHHTARVLATRVEVPGAGWP